MKIKKVSAFLAITGAVTAAMVASIKLAGDNQTVVEDDMLVAETAGDSVSLTALKSNTGVVITEAKGDQESLYATFKGVSGASGYNAYVKKGSGSYVKLDTQLIRTYSGSYRVDAVGLSAGTYTLKIVPVFNGSETSDAKQCALATDLNVISYDRSGFGFSKNSKNSSGDASGAYNTDGSLKSNAKVFYVTSKTAKTISTTVVTDSKGTKTTCTGLQAIITAYQKGYDTTPVAFRFIGKVSASDMDSLGSSSEGLQIKGKTAGSMMNMTFEGIGDDATIYGFGFLIRNSNNVEVRNLGFMTKMDDNVSIDTGNYNIWVHDCDFFYGAAGSGDHAKGDGALDIKGTYYATLSYNHFWDCGKTTLNSNGDAVDYVSYHHNWYDHSDSRHPRVRKSTAIHVYNNYFDGNAKYGVGATTGCSIFVEANYFRNCKNPMLSSLQGTDAQGEGTFSSEAGGMIKAYNNKITGASGLVYANASSGTQGATASANSKSFDAYLATSRNETVSSSYKTVSGGTTYSNFDTDSSIMYSYSVQTPDQAVSTVQAYAGRVGGGDLKWTFNNSTEDTNYAVIPGLRSAIDNYSSKMSSYQTTTYASNSSLNVTEQTIGGSSSSGSSSSGSSSSGSSSSGSSSSGSSSSSSSTATSSSWNFKDTNFKSLGTISSTKTIDNLTLLATSAKTMSVKSASVTVDGASYTNCLALGGAGTTTYRSVKVPVSGASTIKVTLDASASRTLVVADANGKQLGTIAASTTAATKTYSYTGGSGYIYLYSSNSNINLYKIQVDFNGSTSSSGSSSSSSGSSSSGSSSSSSSQTAVQTLNFNGKKVNASSNVFTVAGSYKDMSYTLNGTKLNAALKMDSKGSIKFTLTSSTKVTVYAVGKSNGTKISVGSNTATLTTTTTAYTYTLSAGTYTISRVSGESYIFAVQLG